MEFIKIGINLFILRQLSFFRDQLAAVIALGHLDVFIDAIRCVVILGHYSPDIHHKLYFPLNILKLLRSKV